MRNKYDDDRSIPVHDGFDAQEAVVSMVRGMIQAERARFAEAIRGIQIQYTSVSSSDPLNPFSVQGPPDIEQFLQDLVSVLDPE